MPLMLEDLKDNVLYSRQIILPIDEKDKKKGSVIHLLTPNMEESIRIMNNERFFRNPQLFTSYYMEKDINLIINEGAVTVSDDDIVLDEVSLSKYTRRTIVDDADMISIVGVPLGPTNNGIVFMNGDQPVGHIIYNGNILKSVEGISIALERDMLDFAVDVLKCTNTDVNLADKHKKYLIDKRDFHYLFGKKNGPLIAPGILDEAYMEVGGLELLQEGSLKLNIEIAMWKAQVAIVELILKHHENENWMKHNFKAMKAKLSKIPLPGYVRTIDDSLDSLKDELANYKATLSFMTAIAALEARETFDLSDITAEYVSWIKACKCSKKLKLKIIRELKDSYRETIKTYEYNIKRYERQSEAKQKIESSLALVGKVSSIFSFLTGGPLGILKSTVKKAILPKSQKQNVLSVEELEAKIDTYSRIILELERLEDEIEKESVEECVVINESVISDFLNKHSETIIDLGYVAAMTIAYKISPVALGGFIGLSILADKFKKDKQTIMKKADGSTFNEKEFKEELLANLETIKVDPMLKEDFIAMAEEDYLSPSKNYQEWLDMFGAGVYYKLHEKEKDLINMDFSYYTFDGQKFSTLRFMDKNNQPVYVYLICRKKNNKDHLAFVRVYNKYKDEDNKKAFVIYTDRKILRNVAKKRREESGAVNESFVRYEKCIYYTSKGLTKCNVVLLTGLSGSGKSTYAKKYANKNSKIIAIDDVFFFSDKISKDGNPIAYKYLKDHPELKVLLDKNPNILRCGLATADIARYGEEFIDFAIAEAKKDSNNVYIIEGVQIYKYYPAYKAKNYNVIITDTGAIGSYLRMQKREISKDPTPERILKKAMKAPKTINVYNEEEHKLQEFISELKTGADITESNLLENALLEAKYSRPYNRKEIEARYGKSKLDQLMKDEAHRFRADTGIELIHQEPTKDELERIMKNWKLMDRADKKTSDDMSYKLYGMSNEEHYNQLIGVYNEETLLEGNLTADQRKNLSDSDYGLPAKKKYPMPDRDHVKAAIRMFNHVDSQDEKILATAINRKVKEFGLEEDITVSKKNRYYNYCPTSMREAAEVRPLREDVLQENTFVRDKETITFFESALVEDASYNTALKRILYSERIKKQKEILVRYENIKNSCPQIRKTFLDIDKYKGLNLFMDMSYYTEIFVKNNYLKLDKGINIFFEFINRFLTDKRLKENGYGVKTVIIPVECWNVEKETDIWDFKFNLNPISIIYRLMMTGSLKIKEWAGYNFIFLGTTGFFKLDFATFDKQEIQRFKSNITKLIDRAYIEDDGPASSAKAITIDVLGIIERKPYYKDAESDIAVNNLTGGKEKISKEEIKKRVDDAKANSDGEIDEEKEIKKIEDNEKLLAKVQQAADNSADTEQALKKLEEDEELKQIIADLKMSSPNSVDYSTTRVSRINKLNDEYLKNKYKGKTLGEILDGDDYKGAPLAKSSIPVDSTNEEWQNLTGANLAVSYDVNNDIYGILYHFGNCTVPVSVRDIKIENTSTSEDSVYTWNVFCEDINGKRFTLKFDVPIVINKRFMKLRGNEKVMGNQLMNLPIIKTDLYTTQITTNYNKIFISPYGNNVGKSFVTSDRLIKALKKYDGKNIKIVTGDNSRVCRKYELPLDYIDLASSYMSITLIQKDKKAYEFVFNQDALYEKNPNIDKNRLAYGYYYADGKEAIMYNDTTSPVSAMIASILCSDPEFKKIYDSTSVSTKYTYSKASIMSSEIPVAVLIGYAIGLIPMLDRAKIKYEITDKRPHYDKSTHDILKLEDAYITYELTYDSSLLLNGLKECDLANYSIKEVNSRAMWLDFLDLYGGRIKSDGLDMFYDLMFDPITKSVCFQYELPDNYIDALIYANMLLSDNKYNKHTDISGNRYRNNEIIAAYTYKALANSYTQYRRNLKIGRDSTMTIKQSAVIDLILADNTESDYSSLSPLLEFESANATSFKGLSGMNSERAYGVDKRSYDKSMVNVLAMSTGFAATAGVNRQSTIDPNISTTRGFIKSNPDKLSITQTFCMTEALTPYGVTSDDPFRTAMTFTQTSKHGMRTSVGDPLMVTTGADEALVYLTSDTFSHKAKAKGKVKEVTKDYLVIEYDKPISWDMDDKAKTTEVVDLREHMVKNSDGGFYQSLKLTPNVKEGDTVRENDVVAIDKLSYNNSVGPRDNYAYNIGTFCKFAVVMSDEGFEDSCRSTEWLAKAMSSEVIIEHEYTFNKDTNIYHLVKAGQQVQEGEPIIIFQNAFDDEDANALIRALKADDEDIVEEIGRITLKSKVTGTVKEVKVRRCVETDECSPTLQKVIKDYEKSVAGINKAYEKYDKDKAKTADPTYKLPPTGKLKNATDSVMITIYISYQDDFGVSDKTVCYSALKGVSSKEIIPAGEEAYSTFRPDEKIHYIQGEIGDFKRMVGSIFKIGALNKVLVELHRNMCDTMGIDWKYYDEE